jgi:hypothetical protein
MEQYSTWGKQRKAELLVAAYGGQAVQYGGRERRYQRRGLVTGVDEREDEGELFLQVGFGIRRPRSEFAGRAE